MNYEDYYNHCKKTAKISEGSSLPDLDINNQQIIGSIENYDEKIKNISQIITSDNSGWDSSDPLFINYPNIQKTEGVMELGNEFSQILSREFFGCQMVFDRVECYKNKITNSNEHSSWKWHYDDCAPYRYKIMIYLSDVNEGNGGMKVIFKPDGNCVTYKSSRIKIGKKKESEYVGSRVPDSVVSDYLSQGYYSKEIIGSFGTTLFFHQNILHKATIPTKEPSRTCIIYNFRPYHKIVKDNFFINRTDGSNSGGVKDYSTSID